MAESSRSCKQQKPREMAAGRAGVPSGLEQYYSYCSKVPRRASRFVESSALSILLKCIKRGVAFSTVNRKGPFVESEAQGGALAFKLGISTSSSQRPLSRV